jgi:hypothetical protein
MMTDPAPPLPAMLPFAMNVSKPEGNRLELIEAVFGTSYLDHLDPGCRKLFVRNQENCPDGYIGIQLLGHQDYAEVGIANFILDAIEVLFPSNKPGNALLDDMDKPIPRKVTVAVKAKKMDKDAVVHLLWNITPELVRTLAVTRIVGTNPISFITHTDVAPLPTFVGTFKHLKYTKVRRHELEEEIREVILDDRRVRGLIRTSYMAIADAPPPDDLYRKAVNTLSLRYDGQPNANGKIVDHVWHMYWKCPIADADYSAFVQAVKSVNYIINGGKVEFVLSHFKCNYCKNLDHGSSHCAIRARPDWYDTPDREAEVKRVAAEEKAKAITAAIEAAGDAQDGSSNGRGARGGGRGRGGARGGHRGGRRGYGRG